MLAATLRVPPKTAGYNERTLTMGTLARLEVLLLALHRGHLGGEGHDGLLERREVRYIAREYVAHERNARVRIRTLVGEV